MTARKSNWIANPQRVWIRRALFQVHLWTGLAIGLYVVVMSATGAAIVFRGELGRLLTPLAHVEPNGTPIGIQELTASAQQLYPRFVVDDVRVSSDPTAVVEIVFRRGNRYRDRVFDPYTGKDLGDRVPREPRSIEWIADLHDNLLGGERGRVLNGIGAICFTALCVTGAIVWWPGIERWRRSLTINWRASWRRIVWETHSALGVWLFVLLLLWAISGIYLAFPDPFNALVDEAQAITNSNRAGALGNDALLDLANLHFGRIGGTWMKAAWVALGFAPALLFGTGFVMWWVRKGRTFFARSGAR